MNTVYPIGSNSHPCFLENIKLEVIDLVTASIYTVEIETSGVKEDAESGVKSGVKGGVKELSDIQEIIVREMLFAPSITTSEMAQKTGIKFRTLQRHISQLQAMGIVVRKDGRKDGYWEVVKNK